MSLIVKNHFYFIAKNSSISNNLFKQKLVFSCQNSSFSSKSVQYETQFSSIWPIERI